MSATLSASSAGGLITRLWKSSAESGKIDASLGYARPGRKITEECR